MITAKDNHARGVFLALGASNHSSAEREKNDYYATEPKAVELLLQEETFTPKVWEPACGEGHIAKVLQKHGYNVLATDLVDRGFGAPGYDFLKTYLDGPCYTDIVTNPPYKYAQEFVEHAMEIIEDGRKVAMFLKIQFLESRKRKAMFEKYPPKVIYVASGRLTCAINGDFEHSQSSPLCYAWFVWEKGYKGDPIIKWIN